MVKVLNYTNDDLDFYPTPKDLARKMLAGIDWRMISNVLEPSAGKGDLVEAIFEAWRDDIAERCGRYNVSSTMNRHSLDCIEIDTNLRTILRDKINRIQNPEEDKYEKYNFIRLVYDDFLKFKPFKKYDLIVMNPPFSNGAAHLLKAISIVEDDGGSIVCLLNAETIRNPFNESCKALKKKLDEYGAEVQFISNAFSGAERKTNVEIALIRVCIPEQTRESDIYNHMRAAEEKNGEYIDIDSTTTELDVTDYIKSAVAHFNVEANCGIEMIRQYYALKPYISITFDDKDVRGSLLSLSVCGREDGGTCKSDINGYMRALRLKYWGALLRNPKFIGKLTSKARDNYQREIDKLKDYDFNEFNIGILSADIMSNVKSSIEDEIIAMFDRLTAAHSWYGEENGNRHYFDGWATNKAWKIGKKVILPCYGVFSEWDGRPRAYEAHDVLADIEKVLNYFDGNMTADVDLELRIRNNFDEGITRNIHCKLFDVTFYKKGTVHITFTNPDLIERFNIFAAQNRGWLPPSYGKKRYNDMSEADKKVVDSFQGRERYEEVLRKSGYFLTSPTAGAGLSLLSAAV